MVNLYDACTKPEYCDADRSYKINGVEGWNCGVTPCDCLCHQPYEIIRLLREEVKVLHRAAKRVHVDSNQ